MNQRKSVAGLSRHSLATASLLWAGRCQRRRVGINQPQADRFQAQAFALVRRSFFLIPLAPESAKPGRGTASSL